MVHRRSFFSPLVLLVLLGGLGSACSGEGADAQTAAPTWYTADALLANLRPEDRQAAAQAVAPLRLDQLPLYDFSVTLERPAPNQARFQMVEDIFYTNTTGETLDSVVLRLYANAVGDQPQVRLTGSECVGQECQVAWDQRSTFEVRPATPLAPNGRLRIRLQLAGTLQYIDGNRTSMFAQAMEGLARQGGGEHGDYGLLAHGSGIASMGNFYAMVAPRRAGDWVRGEGSTLGDLGADGVCHFRARVRAPAGSRVAITGEIQSDRTHLAQGDEPAFTEVVAVAGMARNFAIVVSDQMEVASRRVGPVEVRSWFLRSDRTRGEAALAAGAAALSIFEEKFGRYPYTDLELVEAPLVGGAGGVEFSGLVTLATMFYQSALGGMDLGALGGLLGGSGSPIGGMQDSMLEFVVAHEVAHQWWHGIVGSDARAHPFVDESLAQFSALLYMEERYDAARAEREGARQVAGNYHMMRLQGGADGAVDQPAANFSSEVAYAGLVYGKGPYLYPALRDAVGARAFYRHLRAYVTEHRFRVAASRALIDRMATGAHTAEVRRLERRWLEENHGDEDLGPANMERMMQSWMGEASGLGDMLEALGVGGAGAPGATPNGGANGPTPVGPNPEQALQDLVRQLENLGR